MKFTPVSVEDVPAVTRGRSEDSVSGELIKSFIAANIDAAKVQLDGEKLSSAATKLGSYCRRHKLPVRVGIRGGTDLYLFSDADMPQHYRDLDTKVAQRNAEKAAKAAAETANEPSADDADVQTFDGSDEDAWEDEGSELA